MIAAPAPPLISTPTLLFRSAVEADVPAICDLVNGFAQQNLMLYRTPAQVRVTLGDFIVAEEDDRLVGCGYLSYLDPNLVEIRSLAVHPSQQGKGVGAQIVKRLVEIARARGIPQVCALTLAPAFFERIGFKRVDRWSITPKIWTECVYCAKFHACDEIAMLMVLDDATRDALPSPD